MHTTQLHCIGKRKDIIVDTDGGLLNVSCLLTRPSVAPFLEELLQLLKVAAKQEMSMWVMISFFHCGPTGV